MITISLTMYHKRPLSFKQLLQFSCLQLTVYRKRWQSKNEKKIVILIFIRALFAILTPSRPKIRCFVVAIWKCFVFKNIAMERLGKLANIHMWESLLAVDHCGMNSEDWSLFFSFISIFHIKRGNLKKLYPCNG